MSLKALTQPFPLSKTFLWWYLREGLRIPSRGWEYAKVTNAILSIGFLLRTLFSPWKNIVEKPKVRGIAALGGIIAMSLISRGIGAVIRIAAIVIALTLQCAVLAFTVSYFLVWIAYPIVLLSIIIHVLVVLL